MKIIRQGDKDAADRKRRQIRRFECLSCGTIFECDFGEWKWKGGQYEEYEEATCPTCDQPVSRIVPTH